ncbi:MAG: thiamine-phosphate kinase, partial [Thermoplasmatales archaeon]|nr:thiamine-phosphate kinase [Thermoplasmatales archaeon]
MNETLHWFYVKKLSDLGERKAIKLISKILTKGDTAVGIGDDCAAIDLGDEYLLVSTDMISEKTHIPEQMTPFQIGWFIVAINLSDIAAKGGEPLGLVLSFGLPKNTTELFLTELTKGADACATKFGTHVIGGDTKETGEINICGTAFGVVKKDEFMPRKGACPDDVVAVTGTLGKAGAGYFNLKNKTLDNDISKALLEPVPKLKEGRLLADQKWVTSCMDLSDGLSSSLYQLSDLNNVGFEIDQSKIPLSSELLQLKKKKSDLNVFDFALHFGGDYELLLTIPEEYFEKTKKIMEKNGSDLFAIGKVTEKKDIILIFGDDKKILENKG